MQLGRSNVNPVLMDRPFKDPATWACPERFPSVPAGMFMQDASSELDRYLERADV